MTRVNKFKFTTTILITDNWIEDGFELTEDKIIKQLKDILPYAFENEILVKMSKIEKVRVSIPSFKEVKSSGYK